MRSFVRFSSIAFCAVLLASCEANRRDTGALTGALVGGILGNQVGGGTGKAIATLAGVFVGAKVGHEMGSFMDRMDGHDRARLNDCLETMRTRTSRSWSNPDNGRSYQVEVLSTEAREDQPCRRFRTFVTIDGKREGVEGRACRRSDGRWYIVS